MKPRLKNCLTLNLKIESKDCEIIKNLKEKYAVNISAFVRNCLREKFKELESKK